MEEQKKVDRRCAGEDGINLLYYWKVIQKHKKLISRIVVIGAVATAVVSLFMSDIYQAKALISPVSSKDAGGAGMSVLAQQFGALTGLASLPLPVPGTTSAAEVVNLLKSNIVREKMIEKNNLLPVLFHQRWDADRKDWKKGFTLNPSLWIRKAAALIKPQDARALKKADGIPDIQEGLRELNNIVSVRSNIKENTVTVTVDYDDPQMAANLAMYLLDALNDQMTGESKRVAKINKDYLEDQITKNSDPIIQQKIYNLIAQQIETIMMAEVKENFAFKILDPPMVPDEKVRPKRTLMVMIAVATFLFLGVCTAFFKEYLENIKTKSAGGQRGD